jgi:hypothetical protein
MARAPRSGTFSEKLLVDAFKEAGKRFDMWKCCLHFKVLR